MNNALRVRVTARTAGLLAELIGHDFPVKQPTPLIAILTRIFPDKMLVITAHILSMAEGTLGGDHTPDLLVEFEAGVALSAELLQDIATQLRATQSRGDTYKTIVMNRGTAVSSL